MTLVLCIHVFLNIFWYFILLMLTYDFLLFSTHANVWVSFILLMLTFGFLLYFLMLMYELFIYFSCWRMSFFILSHADVWGLIFYSCWRMGFFYTTHADVWVSFTSSHTYVWALKSLLMLTYEFLYTSSCWRMMSHFYSCWHMRSFLYSCWRMSFF